MLNLTAEQLAEARELLEPYSRLYGGRVYLLTDPRKEKVRTVLSPYGEQDTIEIKLPDKANGNGAEYFLAGGPDMRLNPLFERLKADIIIPIPIDDHLQMALAAGQSSGKSDPGFNVLRIYSQTLLQLLRNQRLRHELDRYARQTSQMVSEMGALHEISRSIDSSQNLDNLLLYIVQKAMDLMHSEAASMMLTIPETNELEFKVVLGPKSEEVKPFRLPIGKGIAGWVAEHNEPILIPDAYSDPRFDPSFDKRSGFRTRSYLCVPLTYKSKVLGVASVLNRLDGKPFTENDRDLLMTFGSQAALSIENARLLQAALEKERLDRELQVASEIQQLLLPAELPKIPHLDIAATYIPCKEVSGDFYDIIPLNDHEYVFVVADVSGKGVPGAMLVSTMQATLKAYFEYSNDLLSVVHNLNRRIIANTTEDRYITFFFGLYDTRNSRFHYVNAGHNPPLLLVDGGEIIELKTGGIFLGYTPWEYESGTLQLEKGNLLLMYTDGLVEAENRAEEMFGEQRIKDYLRQNGNQTAHKLMSGLVRAVEEHTQETHLEDDFTLVIIKKE